MINILVSKCLLGFTCRYDGKCSINDTLIKNKDRFNIIPICPEQLGGLSTPRDPNEIKDNKVLTKNGIDNTKLFHLGALKALEIAKTNKCEYAILKSKSPSCGSDLIYDGSFTNRLIKGQGITCKLLKQNNIKVFNENNIEELIKVLDDKNI